ncbi:glycine--tRNA ligase, partial [Candidatus Woesearchaeota archaeon]|nr:glycine--tRNA ligase [Candidatus Woesearchaeota archaeon]
MTLTIEDMAVFCKKKGFVYPSSEVYGGYAGFFDYGPLGVELKNNIKKEWWKTHVHQREDIVGIDGAIITHPKVWQASGHVECFEDVMLECTKCHNRIRGDHLLEAELKIAADGLSKEDITKLVKENNIKCPNCKGQLAEAKQFNLMFSTNVGPVQSDTSKSYLRPETAQTIFTNFRLVQENSRLKLPFGIAQVGKAFRNEISPRDFLFRCREFEMMEIEYFIEPKKINECPYLKDVLKHELLVFSSDMQEKKKEPKKMTIKQALDKKIIKTAWHAYWLAFEHLWFINLGALPENFRIRQHLATEKSHYALDTWDLEYQFPFGWKELQGMANRTDFDLKQHIEHSKKDLSIFEEETKKRIIPHVVAEPSLGVGRAFLVLLFDAFNDDKKRGNIVLKLHPLIAPIKLGVFPLVNKLEKKSREVFDLLKSNFNCIYDKSGSVGRRYARADEIGIPYCITIDFDSLEKDDVTIRERDTTKQVRV